MALRKFTAAEKGKAHANNDDAQPKLRICAPELDTSKLIMENSLTLIGRVVNPREQPISLCSQLYLGNGL